jgi:hypothetical protein
MRTSCGVEEPALSEAEGIPILLNGRQARKEFSLLEASICAAKTRGTANDECPVK